LEPEKFSQSFYEIRVEGELGDMWMDWFEGLSIRKDINEATGKYITVLYGPVPDQPALHGIIAMIRDLNLALISVRKIAEEDR
jgi:hypothetical protein